MKIENPTQLVDEFKKSGEFDRLRRELLTQFQGSDGMSSFKSRIEEISRQRLESDQKLHHMPQESVYRELLQEIDRYPIVERAIADVRLLSDPSFAAGIRKSVQKLLREEKELTTSTQGTGKSNTNSQSDSMKNGTKSAQTDLPSPQAKSIIVEATPKAPAELQAFESLGQDSTPPTPPGESKSLAQEVSPVTESEDTLLPAVNGTHEVSTDQNSPDNAAHSNSANSVLSTTR